MSAIDPAVAIDVIEKVRATRPRVHCLTNIVAQTFTANVLLAIGAVPSMSADESEVGGFVAGAGALLVNLGMLGPSMCSAINVAMDVAAARGKPIVLDPVFADRSDARAAFARDLLGRRPTVLRCNQDEAEALGNTALKTGLENNTIIVLTGPVDRITSAERQTEIRGGHPLMTQVTAMGCALGAVQAAFQTAGVNDFDAAGAACLMFKRAGQAAGVRSAGPGTFVPAFLDVLFGANEDLLRSDAADFRGN